MYVFTVKPFASPTDRSKLAEGQEVTVNLAAGDQEVDGVITELDNNATTSGNSEIYEGVVGDEEFSIRLRTFAVYEDWALRVVLAVDKELKFT